MDIPYPSQHTMSSNHQPASEMPFKCFRCGIAKGRKEYGERGSVAGEGGGGGLATGRRATLKPIQTLWVCFFFGFFCMCCCFCTV